jgi:parallel beta-helix repeat protein
VEIRDLSFLGSNENAIEIRSASNIVITGCEIKYSGKNALQAVSTSNLTLQQSLIEESYDGGVFLQWEDKNPIIRNNVINKTYMFPGMGRNGDMVGYAIYMSESSSNGLIEQNRIINTGYSGINFNGNHTVVKNNLIDTFCLIKDDGAGIYTYTGSSNRNYTNRKVIDNIVLNAIGSMEGTKPFAGQLTAFAKGIYMDDNSSGVEIRGNSIANIANSGIFIHNARNIEINNNTVFN